MAKRKGKTGVSVIWGGPADLQGSTDALRTSEAKLRRLYDSGLLGVIYWNMKGGITDANDKFLQMVGYTREDLTAGRIDWINMTPPEYRRRDEESIDELKSTGANKAPFEKEYVRKDGTRIPVILAGAMLDESRLSGVAFVLDITERKRSQLEHEKVARQRQLALDAAHMGWWHYDPIGRVASWDEGYKEIFGVKEEGLPIDNVLNRIIHPDDLPGLWAKVEAALNPIDPRPFVAEYRINRPDGALRWIEAHGIATFEGEGNDRRAVSFVGTVADITLRRQAEEALRVSEQNFAVAFAGNPAAIAITRLHDGLFVEVNDTWVALSGFSREETIGHSARAMRIWPTPEAASRFVKELTEKGSIRGWEQEFYKKSGENYVAQLSAQVLDVRGERVVLTTMVDITGQRRREEELRRLNRTLKALGRSSQAMMRATEERSYLREVCDIIVKDCGHAMVWIGYAEDDENKSVRPVAWSGFEEGYLDTLKLTWAETERGLGPTGTAIRTGKPSFCRDMLADPKFAPWREEALKRGYASSLVLPLKTDGRCFGAMNVYFREPDPFRREEIDLLTELADDLAHGIRTIRLQNDRARAEEALRLTAEELARSNEDLQQFAHAASHDLQEPLRMIKGFLRLLEEQYKPMLDEKGREYIGFSVEGAMRMSQLIRDLLEYSKVNSQGRKFQRAEAGQALAEAMENLRTIIQESGAVVTHDELPVLVGDPTQLMQLFQNLIGNAIKFRSPDRPCRIHVGVQRLKRQIVIRIRDNGIGISRDAFDRIFIIFQRLHARQEYQGTGIGLAICKKIVERHGGRIWVESEPGQGSTFSFSLPEPRDC